MLEKGDQSRWATRCFAAAQHDRTALLSRPHGRPVQTAHAYNQKYAHNKPIAVLKNTPQNVAYLWPIQ